MVRVHLAPCESAYREMNGSHCSSKMDWGALIYFVVALPHFVLLKSRIIFQDNLSLGFYPQLFLIYFHV